MRVRLSSSLLSNNQAADTDEELQQQQIEHRGRSKARLRISDDDVARMVTAFVGSNDDITKCAPAYAALSSQHRL